MHNLNKEQIFELIQHVDTEIRDKLHSMPSSFNISQEMLLPIVTSSLSITACAAVEAWLKDQDGKL